MPRAQFKRNAKTHRPFSGKKTFANYYEYDIPVWSKSMFMRGRLVRAVAAARMALVFLSLQAAGSLPLAGMPPGSMAGNIPLVTNVLQLRHAANDDPGSLVEFSLQGTVVEFNASVGIIVLQDESGIELLETPLAGLALVSGQEIRLEGTNFVVPSAFGVDIERRPLVDNDGLHSESERSGSVYLRKGRFPIRVLWFNYTRFRSLSVEYSGPNFARRKIPDAALFSASVLPDGSLEYAPGLKYRCFEDSGKVSPHYNPWIQ
jgi:hypothetical protein